MEEISIKKLLEEEFKDDPIYKLALLNKLGDKIFTESILGLHKDPTYSTMEAGKIIERSDSTIRNHFRSELIDYIRPEKFGKFYRLNYISIFKLHLIFLLMDTGKTTIDILAELGETAGAVMGSDIKRIHRNNKGSRNDGNGLSVIEDDTIQEINSTLAIMMNLMKIEKERAFLEREIMNLEDKINDIHLNSKMELTQEIVDIEREIMEIRIKISHIQTQSQLKLLEEKQSIMITNSLKNTLKKPSFWSFFKKSEVDIYELSEELEQKLKTKYDIEIQESSKKLDSELNNLKEKKNASESKLEKIRLWVPGSLEQINEFINLLDKEDQLKIREYLSQIETLQEKQGLLEYQWESHQLQLNSAQNLLDRPKHGHQHIDVIDSPNN